ncbi:MAG: ubiquinone/menaquinone biosynthesis methyltransferase [Methanobacteriota archaeon]|nr:MAG: ubiquinone/menaquinone biosynthesis methyltransferase [Euryarchaeota archaeon]
MERPGSKRGKARYIRRMFSDLSRRYDLASTAIAFGRDRGWRDFAASKVDGAAGMILDVCCGTGELSRRLVEKTGGRVVAVDFCREMVEVAREKFGGRERLSFGVADIERLPFPDETFTCATVGFALRNVTDIRRALSEMTRVVKRGGMVIVLDLGKPGSSLFRKLYYLYFYRIAPRLGGFMAGKGAAYAYRYLPSSLTDFPAQRGIERMMRELGLVDVRLYDLDMGIVAVHVGKKPG